MGTYGGGLFRLDAKGRWQRFADLTGPIEINPNAMAVTDDACLRRHAVERAAGLRSPRAALDDARVRAAIDERDRARCRSRAICTSAPTTASCASGHEPPAPASCCSPRSSRRFPLLGDLGVLIPSGSSAPDPAILSLDQMAIDIRIDNGDARVSVRQVFASHRGGVLEGEYLLLDAEPIDGVRLRGLGRRDAHSRRHPRASPGGGDLRGLTQQQIDPGLLQQGERGIEGASEATRTSAFSARIVADSRVRHEAAGDGVPRSRAGRESAVGASRCRSGPTRTTRSRRASSPSRSAWSPPTRSRTSASTAAPTRCSSASRRRTASPARLPAAT